MTHCTTVYGRFARRLWLFFWCTVSVVVGVRNGVCSVVSNGVRHRYAQSDADLQWCTAVYGMFVRKYGVYSGVRRRYWSVYGVGQRPWPPKLGKLVRGRQTEDQVYPQ